MDISMCQNKKCKDRKTCFRYNAKPDKLWQSYLLIEGEKTKDTCNNYWKMRKPKRWWKHGN